LSRVTVAIAGAMTLLAVALTPAAAQADPAINCVDNKPAVGFSFTCDAPLAVPPDGTAYPLPDGRAFFIGFPPPDGYSTLSLTSFNVPGSQCSVDVPVNPGGDTLACSSPVAAGQTVSGTVSWKIGFSPRVPLSDCVITALDGYARDPGPYGEFDRRIPTFPLQVCRSPSPPDAAAPHKKCKKKHKRSAVNAKKKKCKKAKR
jgi:hypothetical protein